MSILLTIYILNGTMQAQTEKVIKMYGKVNLLPVQAFLLEVKLQLFIESKETFRLALIISFMECMSI